MWFQLELSRTSTYRILHKLSFNINFYEMGLGNVNMMLLEKASLKHKTKC